MSGIAEILVDQGFKITGSDLVESENTKRLELLGAKVRMGHNVKNLDIVAHTRWAL